MGQKKKNKKEKRDKSKAGAKLLPVIFYTCNKYLVREHIVGVFPVPSLTGSSEALGMWHGGSTVDS